MSDNKDSSKDNEKLDAPTSTLKLNRSFSRIQHSVTPSNRSNTVTVEVKRKRFGLNSEKPEATDTEFDSNSRLQAIKNAAEAASKAEAERKNNELKRKEDEALKALITPVVPLVVEITPQVIGPEAVKPEEHKRKIYDRDPEVEAPKKHAHAKLEPAKASKSKYDDSRKIAGKINSHSVSDDDDDVEGFRPRSSMAALKRRREKAKRHNMTNLAPVEKIIKEVILPETITVQDLANRMSERVADVTKQLMKLGMMVTGTQIIDADTAEIVIETFGHKFKRVTEGDVENILQFEDKDEDLERRSPVVTIMGHVDHGKTSLLDALRSSDVALGEAGGITQHIGAYQITLASGDHITFIDTPGHEAFTAMRSRGAKATDIVVLVVAADDGIMAQTIEAINHAKAAEVPIIVAINKIDKPGSDPMRVKSELLNHGLVSEDLGGDILIIEVSAKQKLNLDKLESAILLQAEMLNLRANFKASASGMTIESKVDKARGVITTLLVQRGTLKLGDIIVAGCSYGKVRVINDDKGRKLSEALPSMPVEILGLNLASDAGETFSVVESEKQAREITEYRLQKKLTLKTAMNKRGSLEELLLRSNDGKTKELPIIIKADVQGSIEAIAGSLQKISTDEVKVKMLHAAVGGITESDIALAKASRAMVLGFNVRANNQARQQAESESVDIRYYSIIYNLIDDIKSILSGMLAPTIREEYIGQAEIRKVYNITKVGKVAGCYVTSGYISRGAGSRLLRDNIVIHEGKLKTLRRFKDDVKEVNDGYECGIAFENYEDIREGDKVEAFKIIEEARTL